MKTQQLFLGRQPIVGTAGELVAYELLMRSSEVNAAHITNDVGATSAVIQYAMSDLGLAAVLGVHSGYINIPQELLLSDVLEFLPKDNIVLELLETVEATPEVVARCAQLSARGYRIALDDVVEITPTVERLLPFAQIVKIDILRTERAQAVGMATDLAARGILMLAEKVETYEDFHFYKDNHFVLFQGYYFARPSILSGRSLHPSAAALMHVLSLIVADADIEPLVAAIKHSPGLTLQLLKVANSAAFRIDRPISSLHQAVMILGRIQLGRVVQIMVFAQCNGLPAHRDPLLQTALIRAHMMEGLSAAVGETAASGRGFMAGMLSMLEPLFGQPAAQLIGTLNLDDALRDALLNGAGTLGALLRVIELTERDDLPSAAAQLAALGITDLAHYNRAHMEAIAWANRSL
jgi:c-di-GMP-related signal transduction protein